MKLSLVTASVAVMSVALAANASITSTSGMATYLGTPPVSAQQFNLTGMTAYCWNEQSGITSSATPVNIASNGLYTGFSPFNAVISGTFDSHFVHFDPSPFAGGVGGAITFSQNIVGVIYDETLLSLSDGPFGAGGTTYDTGNFLRSMNSNIIGGNVITVSGNTLTFQLGTGLPGQINRMVELRVLTLVPSPATAGMISLGGLISLRRRRR